MVGVVVWLAAGGPIAAAAPPADPGDPPGSVPPAAPPVAGVPLLANFSRFELGASAAAVVAGGALLLWGGDLFGAPSPGMGVPSPDSLDARWARSLGRPGDGRFLAGITDVGGIYVLPVLPALAYGLDVIGIFTNGRGYLRPGDPNPQHRLAAYVEAAGFTMFVTGAVKTVVGRPRPYTEGALNRPELRHRVSEDNLSFFSGHSSLAFAAGAFVTADVSRALLHGPLAAAGPTRRFLLGEVLPTVVGYGIPALVGVSRVIDQQHWPSDVLVGALVGGLIGNLAYERHFDGDGAPRWRLLSAARPVLLARPGAGPVLGLGTFGRF